MAVKKQLNAQVDEAIYIEFYKACKFENLSITQVVTKLMKDHTAHVKKVNHITEFPVTP